MSSDRQHRLEIVQFGRLLHQNGFVAATDGNLSVRLDDERLLVTPTCISKGRMRASDMVIVDMDGKRIAGKRRVSSEIGMHLLIYRLRPDVCGIVHAHPPTATGFASSGCWTGVCLYQRPGPCTLPPPDMEINAYLSANGR